MAWVLYDQGRTDQARSLLVRAVELLEQQDPGAELATAYAQLALSESAAGSLSDALAWANKALGVARSCGGSEVLAQGLHIRGLARCESGDTGGLGDLQESQRLDEEAGDLEGTSMRYQNLANIVWLIEGPGKGLELNQRAQDIGHSHGAVHTTLWARSSALPMLFEHGNWDELLSVHPRELLVRGRIEV